MPSLGLALAEMADIFGDGMFAMQNGEHFTCIEAEVVADVLRAAGHTHSAEVWLKGHAMGDDVGDSHYEEDATG
jgi:hypothetical protein